MQNDSGINKKIFKLSPLTKQQYIKEAQVDHKTKLDDLNSKVDVIKKEIEREAKDLRNKKPHVISEKFSELKEPDNTILKEVIEFCIGPKGLE